MSTLLEMEKSVDRHDLESKVKEMYRDVAWHPQGAFHFEMGRGLAERLGYSAAMLDQIPAEAIDSFAGVGYCFQLADIKKGERVLDLGSGSGMDVFFATLQVGPTGEVVGIDMTTEQLKKARELREQGEFSNSVFLKSYIEELPIISSTIDVVISNGVVNLSSDKESVFREAARVLKPGGRLALSDIVTEVLLPKRISCNASLWAACIGGAMQQEAYCDLIRAAGFKVISVQENPNYHFLSKSAVGASLAYGVKSISVLAEKL